MRQIVRRFLFPDHKLRFTGNTAYRVLVPKSRLNHLPEITSTTGWWWGEDGHVYFSDVDDESEYEDPHFEITVRAYQEPEVPGKTVFWGISATNEKVAARVEVREIGLYIAQRVSPDMMSRNSTKESETQWTLYLLGPGGNLPRLQGLVLTSSLAGTELSLLGMPAILSQACDQ